MLYPVYIRALHYAVFVLPVTDLSVKIPLFATCSLSQCFPLTFLNPLHPQPGNPDPHGVPVLYLERFPPIQTLAVIPVSRIQRRDNAALEPRPDLVRPPYLEMEEHNLSTLVQLERSIRINPPHPLSPNKRSSG